MSNNYENIPSTYYEQPNLIIEHSKQLHQQNIQFNTEINSMGFDVNSLLNDYSKALTNFDLVIDDQMKILEMLTEVEVLVKEAINTDDTKKIMDIIQMIKPRNNMIGQEAVLSFLERLYYYRSIQKNELNEDTGKEFKKLSDDILRITGDIDGLLGKLSKIEIVQSILPSFMKLYGGIESRIQGKLQKFQDIVNVDIDNSITSICGQVDLILSNQYSIKYLLGQKNTMDYILKIQQM